VLSDLETPGRVYTVVRWFCACEADDKSVVCW